MNIDDLQAIAIVALAASNLCTYALAVSVSTKLNDHLKTLKKEDK
jgi:hypothetical protein